ncbi:MAG: ATP-binding protein [Polaromonas sp.]|nr:ATP-binding protein [Polaromonas sp.]
MKPQADAAEPAADPAAALQAGVDLATDGIILLDAEGRIRVINQRARELIHSSQAGLPGLEFWDALADDVALAHRGPAEQALQAGATHDFALHDGFEDRWVEYSLAPHPFGVQVNLRDVSTARRALGLLNGTEACNQSLFDGNPQVMWLMDVRTQCLLAVNHAAARFYGMGPNPPVAAPAETLFPEGEGAIWLASLPATAFRKHVRLCTQQKAGGERMLVELSASTVQWFERAAVLVCVVDVGEQHRSDMHLQRLNEGLQERIDQYSAELAHSREQLSTFTNALTEDLKGPLHAVNGFASTLVERYSAALDEQGRHYLARIRASTRQLARLVDDLRTLSQLPGANLVIQEVDLAPVCRRLVEDWRKREPARKLTLELPPALVLAGDPALLVTAVACLIDNAWKFTAGRQQGWIRVGLAEGASPGEVVLSVSDNGAGFDAAYIDRLFNAFQRLHSSADFPGGGLGLAIVRRVAERHGGRAWATSSGSSGASFFMALPTPAATPAPPPV